MTCRRGLKRDGAIENGLRIFEGRLVDIANLVRIHEARDRTSCCSDLSGSTVSTAPRPNLMFDVPCL